MADFSGAPWDGFDGWFVTFLDSLNTDQFSKFRLDPLCDLMKDILETDSLRTPIEAHTDRFLQEVFPVTVNAICDFGELQEVDLQTVKKLFGIFTPLYFWTFSQNHPELFRPLLQMLASDTKLFTMNPGWAPHFANLIRKFVQDECLALMAVWLSDEANSPSVAHYRFLTEIWAIVDRNVPPEVSQAAFQGISDRLIDFARTLSSDTFALTSAAELLRFVRIVLNSGTLPDEFMGSFCGEIFRFGNALIYDDKIDQLTLGATLFNLFSDEKVPERIGDLFLQLCSERDFAGTLLTLDVDASIFLRLRPVLNKLSGAHQITPSPLSQFWKKASESGLIEIFQELLLGLAGSDLEEVLCSISDEKFVMFVARSAKGKLISVESATRFVEQLFEKESIDLIREIFVADELIQTIPQLALRALKKSYSAFAVEVLILFVESSQVLDFAPTDIELFGFLLRDVDKKVCCSSS
jgi:hypothetical protein